MTILTAARTTLGAALLLCSACGEGGFTGSQAMTISDAPARPASRAKAPDVEPRLAKPIVLPDTPPPVSAELQPLAPRGRLLHRLPKSTLLALRFPHVEKLGEAFARTPMKNLFSDPRMGAATAQLETVVAQLESSLSKEFPDYPELKAGLQRMEGELVIALVAVDAGVFSSGTPTTTACPFTAAVMFHVGEHANELDAVVQRLISHDAAGDPQKRSMEVIASAPGQWHRRSTQDEFTLDVRRDGETFLMQLGPGVAAGSKSTPLAARPLDDSFAAAHILRASRDLAQDGSVPVVELFLNLDPVWTITEMFAPPEVKDVLASCGATSIHGVSVAAGLGRTGIDEVIFVDAPGGRDLRGGPRRSARRRRGARPRRRASGRSGRGR
jgi:hypothetical protein